MPSAIRHFREYISNGMPYVITVSSTPTGHLPLSDLQHNLNIVTHNADTTSNSTQTNPNAKADRVSTITVTDWDLCRELIGALKQNGSFVSYVVK
jgi:hypothetical protein